MKNKFTNKEELANFAIRSYLDGKKIPDIDESEIDPSLRHYAATFVTVFIKGNLRGCIGNVEPVSPIFQSIIHNAIAAISEDFRFPSITKNELPDLSIEVSVLSPMRPYSFTNKEKLLKFLSSEKPGLILEKYGRQALFLPQVWKEIPDPEEFLSQLSLKAGLAPSDWEQDTKFSIFTVTV